ncbi:putative parvulin-type peptidyl-prolyl cis-trans isomerase [Pandoraea anapnoica]|uniref:peptidylprolyl isomerase n=1 Tax=Pandoraea anapnoica TaxID=2508301 RepID=A0A5E5AJU6_9BURK|nr:peptidyl-prolyl cis-trans isomerase [Pandoraea anapnoica]VVE73959.1 putative parvulin-type peptidyl-prolyl cis-trans isomerase [Pandoraea anapnoica]
MKAKFSRVWMAAGVCAALGIVTVPAMAAKSAAAPSAAKADAKGDSKASAEKPLPSDAIASVNGVAIPKVSVDAMVKASGQPDSPQLRELFKGQLIANELLKQAAQKQHYDTRPEVQAAVEAAKTMIVTRAFMTEHLKAAPVSDADVKAKYDAVVATLGENEYHASVIAVRDAVTAQTVLDQLKKGSDFAALARQYSQGPNAAQGGQLNWVSFKTPITAGNTQNWPQPIAEALVKLPKGGVSSEPLQIGDQLWILRVDDKRATQIPKFEESAPLLRKQLEQVAMEKATAQMIGDLVKSARIQQ